TDMKETDVWGVKPTPGYEVKLTDAERFQYLTWRRQRDIVQGKPGMAPAKPEKPASESTKESAPFHDRVLEKALEYIRGELNRSCPGRREDSPAGIPMHILFEDYHCLAVDKPAGLLTQAPPGIASLEAMVRAYIKEKHHKPGNVYLGIPHRLDRPVSGVI